MKRDCPKCWTKMLMTAGLAADAVGEPGNAGSKNWWVAIRAQLAHRVLSHKKKYLKVKTIVVKIILLIIIWLVQITVVTEWLEIGIGKLQHMQQLNQLLSSCAKLFWFVRTAGLSTLTMEYMVCLTTSGISVKCVAHTFQLAISVLEYMLLIV